MAQDQAEEKPWEGKQTTVRRSRASDELPARTSFFSYKVGGSFLPSMGGSVLKSAEGLNRSMMKTTLVLVAITTDSNDD